MQRTVEPPVHFTGSPKAGFERIRVPVACASKGGWTIHVPRPGDRSSRS